MKNAMFHSTRTVSLAISAALLMGVATIAPAYADTHYGHVSPRPGLPACYYQYGGVEDQNRAYIQSNGLVCQWDDYSLGVHHEYWVNSALGYKSWTNYVWSPAGANYSFDMRTYGGGYIEAYGYARR